MFQQMTLIGFIAKDAEMRYTPSGVPVASFSLPVNKRWKGADGNDQEKTLWFRVTLWRKQAEALAEYLTKGKLILVIGELEEARTYTDRNGNTAVSLEFTANTIKFLSSGGQRQENSGAQQGTPEEFQTSEDIPF